MDVQLMYVMHELHTTHKTAFAKMHLAKEIEGNLYGENVDGVDKELAAWIRTDQKGQKYMSLKVSDPYKASQQPQQPAQQGGFQQNAPQQSGGFQQNAPQQSGGFQQQGNPQQGGFQQNAPKVNPQEPTIDFDDDIPF